MQAYATGDLDHAVTLYRSVEDENARRLLDYLIDHPDQQRTAAELQQALGFARHQDVARATYLIGEIAAEQGRSRPWGEGQTGYLMKPEMASLFQQARQQAG